VISNSKFKVSDKKIISCKKNNNNTYVHKIIVFDFSVTSEMMAMPHFLSPGYKIGTETQMFKWCHFLDVAIKKKCFKKEEIKGNCVELKILASFIF